MIICILVEGVAQIAGPFGPLRGFSLPLLFAALSKFIIACVDVLLPNCGWQFSFQLTSS